MRITRTTVAAVVAGGILYTLPVVAGPFVQDNSKHAAGIYLETPGKDGAGQVKLRGAMPHEMKTQGMGKMMLTQGLVKASTVFELAGTTADVRTAAASPTFYFYFDTNPAQSSDPMAMMSQMMGGDTMPAGAKTAADFSLIHLTVANGNRQANMGKVGGNSKPKDTVEFTQERLEQGAYRLQPKSPLEPGEYAFVFTNAMGAAGGMTMWDFGIDVAKSK